MINHIVEDKKDLKSMIILFKAHDALIKFIKKDIANTSFDLNEFAVFEVIYHKEKLTVNEIHDKVLVASSSLSYILNKLENKGYINREEDVKDRRIKNVSLTKQGLTKAQSIFPKHYDNLKTIFNKLNKEEQQTLNNLLKVIGFEAKARL